GISPASATRSSNSASGYSGRTRSYRSAARSNVCRNRSRSSPACTRAILPPMIPGGPGRHNRAEALAEGDPMPAQTTGYYLEPAVMTAPGDCQPLLAALPHGVAALAGVAHGLLIHEHFAGVYGVTLTDERRASVHVRPAAALLGRVMAGDSRPLTV